MEICDTLTKSVLKKTNSTVANKIKKVTFCNTVKVFIDIKEESNSHSKSSCLEIGIVDKSYDHPTGTQDLNLNDECKASDFLVHKVIYDNNLEHDDDDDRESDALIEDESSILFEANTEEEGLEFVVHKVTEHEDDLIQQELEFESKSNENISDNVTYDEVIGKLSELSIENILTHDKIIALIDQKSLGLSSVIRNKLNHSEINSLPLLRNISHVNVNSPQISPSLNSEIVLSPPLQELSLDKIVKAQSNNVLSELEISPLNSIQETDSDSDVSSEGTMIMMTTEESEKNEQHIRESFMHFESMKKAKAKDVTIAEDIDIDQNEENVNESRNEGHSNSDLENVNDICENSTNENSISLETDLKQPFGDNVSSNNKCERNLDAIREIYTSGPDILHAHTVDKSFISDEHKKQRQSFISPSAACYWDKSLASIQIPKDVREWKIVISSDEKNPTSQYNPSSIALENEYSSQTSKPTEECHDHNERYLPKSDELESFVHESKERVQRIRKRYLRKAQKRHEVTGSIRGIRPRFGSTAEILQLIQKKNLPPILTFSNRNHVSWPCEDTVSSSDVCIESEEQLKHIFSCQNFPGEYSLQSSFCSYFSEDSISSTCDHDSVSSCPSIFFHERGVPEGASPPRSLSEDSIEQFSNTDNPNNIVYFSMKV